MPKVTSENGKFYAGHETVLLMVKAIDEAILFVDKYFALAVAC